MSGYGLIKAYAYPGAGVRRPLTVYASAGPMPAWIVDVNGDPISSTNPQPSLNHGVDRNGDYQPQKSDSEGQFYTHFSPHKYPEISSHMIRVDGATDTLASAASKGDRVITVGNGAQWSVGEKFILPDGANTEFDHLDIKVIATNDLTLNRPLDADHAASTAISEVCICLARDAGTPSAPKIFTYTPRAGQRIHIHSIHIAMESAGEPALYKFGGYDALEYGIVFRIKKISGRNYTVFRPMVSNSDLMLSGFFYNKFAKVGTSWFTHFECDFDALADSVIYLEGDEGDVFECLVQDDLTDHSRIEIGLSIHEED